MTATELSYHDDFWDAFTQNKSESRDVVKCLYERMAAEQVGHRLQVAIARELSQRFGIHFAPYASADKIPQAEFMRVVYARMREKYQTEAAKRDLLGQMRAANFYAADLRYESADDALTQLVDFSVNQAIVQETLNLYRRDILSSTSLSSIPSNLAGALTYYADRHDADNAMEKRGTAPVQIYAHALRDNIAEVTAKADAPVYVISIGGGNGRVDYAAYQALQEEMPGRKIHFINVDPFITAKEFAFPKEAGTLINTVPIEDQAALAAAIDRLVPPGSLRVVSACRALHHTHLSIGAFKGLADRLGADVTMLVDHPFDQSSLDRLAFRSMRVATEILVNYGVNGPSSWFQSADHFHQQLFSGDMLKRAFDKDAGIPHTNVYSIVHRAQGIAAVPVQAVAGR